MFVCACYLLLSIRVLNKLTIIILNDLLDDFNICAHLCLASTVVLPFRNASSLPTGLFVNFVVIERQQWWLVSIKETGV